MKKDICTTDIQGGFTMKGFAMLGIGKTGWIEKERPECGPLDAIVRPIAVSPCTSDVHTVWEGAIGERTDMILGHEAVGVVEEVGSLVKDFKVGDRVIVSAITPDWSSLEAQAGLCDAFRRNAGRLEVLKLQRRRFSVNIST